MNRPFTADSFWTYDNGVLKNKFDIRNFDELDLKESEIVNNKIKDINLESFELADFLNLHKFLFEDLYEFAGKIRDENIVMNGVLLCKCGVVWLCLNDLFLNLKDVKICCEDDLFSFLAYYYSELSVIAPFRDGNEIVIRKFLEDFVKQFGFVFDFSWVDEDSIREAVLYSFYYDTSKLVCLFKNCCI